MNAIESISRYDSFSAKARAVCHERGWNTLKDLEKVEHYLRWRAYQEAIQPFVKIRLKLMAFKIPKHIVHSDGRMETAFEWTDEEKKAQAQIDELIAAEARRVGLVRQVEV
jgi:hypothetical protein